ncbi:FmdB family zinc ribbon protein [Glaciimonas immobilis]|uniref:Putative FmdB family regulatory protein n=1 Tax=Glaciimonas immobilis TaxID=728004 RepID=A0A840RW21_9BURK|nr:FmdB family zinc ribbon protein [Glaciimonas immobilis]KAF3998533.1 zinc ribbon domain-containing protein [Glaciimonas immobilis]MBB5201382.1 putative FmdB family regulatory protein [Glaciimonas immobilis]
MPIYAYRCEACGFAKDVLQKMSDEQLTICPTCHQESFKKQVTAAGFQLKGTGWYVTDFRGGAATGKAAASAGDEGSSSSSSTESSTPAPATGATAPANGAAGVTAAPAAVNKSESAPAIASKTPSSAAT